MARDGRLDVLWLLFAFTGGAWAWTFQLWLGWALGEPACLLQPGEFTLLGVGGRVLWFLLGILTAGVALLALLVSYRRWRAAGAKGRSSSEPRRFLLLTGLVLNAIFLGTIIMGATSPFFLAPCV